VTERDTCLSPKAVARELSVSAQTIYNLIASGKLPALRVGGQYRILRSELDDFKDRSKVPNGYTGAEQV